MTTWVLISFIFANSSPTATVIGHYSSFDTCMKMGYRVQDSIPLLKDVSADYKRFYCIEEPK